MVGADSIEVTSATGGPCAATSVADSPQVLNNDAPTSAAVHVNRSNGRPPFRGA